MQDMAQARFAGLDNSEWLTICIEAFGYKSLHEGHCFGYLGTAASAYFLGRTALAQFNRRLQLLFDISQTDFINKEFSELSFKEQMAKCLPFAKNDQDKKLIEETPAFLDTITIHHNGSKNVNLFPPEDKQDRKKIQDMALTMPLASSIEFDKKFKTLLQIEKESFSGIYQQNELTAYLDSYYQTLKIMPCTMLLHLESVDHAIHITYDTVFQQWFYFDAAYLTKQNFTNSTELAKQLIRSFNEKDDDNVTAISTKILTVKPYKETVQKFITLWKKNQTWKDLHIVTEKKARLCNATGESWLYMATEIGEKETVQALLKKGADPNRRSQQTTSFRISMTHEKDLIELFFQTKNLNPIQQPNYKILSPLHCAICEEQNNIVHRLLQAGHDVNGHPDDPAPPLGIALEKGSMAILELLLSDPKLNVDRARNDGMPPILISIMYAWEAGIKALLKNSQVIAKINTYYQVTCDNFYEHDLPGLTEENASHVEINPLMYAVLNENIPIIKLLLAHNADPLHSRTDGTTPYELALWRDNKNIITLLQKELLKRKNEIRTRAYVTQDHSFFQPFPVISQISSDEQSKPPKRKFNQM